MTAVVESDLLIEDSWNGGRLEHVTMLMVDKLMVLLNLEGKRIAQPDRLQITVCLVVHYVNHTTPIIAYKQMLPDQGKPKQNITLHR